MFSIVNFYFTDLIGDLLAPSSLVSPNMLIAIEFTAVLWFYLIVQSLAKGSSSPPSV